MPHGGWLRAPQAKAGLLTNCCESNILIRRLCWSISNRTETTAPTNGRSTTGTMKPSTTTSTRCPSGFCFEHSKRPLLLSEQRPCFQSMKKTIYLRRRRAAKPAKASRERVAVVGSGMTNPETSESDKALFQNVILSKSTVSPSLSVAPPCHLRPSSILFWSAFRTGHP